MLEFISSPLSECLEMGVLTCATTITCSFVCYLYSLFGILLPVVKADPLEAYNINRNCITVSGFSSGGAMSTQIHMIYSQNISGAGVFAGLPFMSCYWGILELLRSTTGGPPPPNVLVDRINILAQSKQIDSLINIKNNKVCITTGTMDIIVNKDNSHCMKNVYDRLGANASARFLTGGNHGIPTDNYNQGGPCGSVNPSTGYVNNCNYSGVEYMFKCLSSEPMDSPRGNKTEGSRGTLKSFDQMEFVEGNFCLSGMADVGYIYIPENCESREIKCKLHVAFHGCRQNKDTVGLLFITHSGYIEMADANNIIIVFPQTATSCCNLLTACWDFFGYTGYKTYATKSGIQPKAIMKMIDRISSNSAI